MPTRQAPHDILGIPLTSLSAYKTSLRIEATAAPKPVICTISHLNPADWYPLGSDMRFTAVRNSQPPIHPLGTEVPAIIAAVSDNSSCLVYSKSR